MIFDDGNFFFFRAMHVAVKEDDEETIKKL